MAKYFNNRRRPQLKYKGNPNSLANEIKELRDTLENSFDSVESFELKAPQIAYSEDFDGNDIGERINNALAYLNGLGGGTLYLPPGDHVLTTQINFNGMEKIRMSGEGATNLQSNIEGFAIEFIGSYYCMIERLTITCSYNNIAPYSAESPYYLENVNGIRLASTNAPTSQNNSLENVQIYRADIGLQIGQCQNEDGSGAQYQADHFYIRSVIIAAHRPVLFRSQNGGDYSDIQQLRIWCVEDVLGNLGGTAMDLRNVGAVNLHNTVMNGADVGIHVSERWHSQIYINGFNLEQAVDPIGLLVDGYASSTSPYPIALHNWNGSKIQVNANVPFSPAVVKPITFFGGIIGKLEVNANGVNIMAIGACVVDQAEITMNGNGNIYLTSCYVYGTATLNELNGGSIIQS